MDIKRIKTMDRILGTILVVSCFFGNVFSNLNVDLKIVILTPQRYILLAVTLWCGAKFCLKEFRFNAITQQKNRTKKYTLLFFCVWFLTGAIWLLHSINELSITEVIAIFTILLYVFCFFSLTNDNAEMQFFLNVCIACGVMIAIMANIEIVTGSFIEGVKFNYTLEERIIQREFASPPSGTFYNPNDLAAFTLLNLAIVLFRLTVSKRRHSCVKYGLISLLLISPLPAINSTIFNIMFVFLLIQASILTLIYHRNNIRDTIIKCVCIAAIGSLYFTLISNQLMEFLKTISINCYASRVSKFMGCSIDDALNIIVSNKNDIKDTMLSQIATAQNGGGTIHIRLWLIRAGLVLFAQKPIFGFGPGSFRFQIQEYPEILKQTRMMVDPHNFYVELMVQYGGVLLCAYVLLVLYMLINSHRNLIKDLKVTENQILTIILIESFSVAAIMPSGFIRLTNLWVYFAFAVLAYTYRDKCS